MPVRVRPSAPTLISQVDTPDNPVGVVLAGGRSRRLGRPKQSLLVGGLSLAEAAARKLAAVCSSVVVADDGKGSVVDLPSVADGPGGGPAAGILGAAQAAPGRALLVLACDLPRVPAELLAALAAETDLDWVVPLWSGGLEPLCALYGPGALVRLAARVEAGHMAPHELTEEPGLRIRFLAEEALCHFGDPARVFFNLNTPADLEALRRDLPGEA